MWRMRIQRSRSYGSKIISYSFFYFKTVGFLFSPWNKSDAFGKILILPLSTRGLKKKNMPARERRCACRLLFEDLCLGFSSVFFSIKKPWIIHQFRKHAAVCSTKQFIRLTIKKTIRMCSKIRMRSLKRKEKILKCPKKGLQTHPKRNQKNFSKTLIRFRGKFFPISIQLFRDLFHRRNRVFFSVHTRDARSFSGLNVQSNVSSLLFAKRNKGAKKTRESLRTLRRLLLFRVKNTRLF